MSGPETLAECVIRPISVGNLSNGQEAKHLIDVVDRASASGREIQSFEEGPTLLVTEPSGDWTAAAYIMDLIDASETDDGTCARMHEHPLGDRILTILTGEGTSVFFGTLLRSEIIADSGSPNFQDLVRSTDAIDIVGEDGPTERRTRHCIEIPPDSQVNVRIPKGAAHCVIAKGPNAALVSVHPDEAAELAVTGLSSSMIDQTEFLEPEAVTNNCPADGLRV